ncbi:hypothetical protein CE205_12640 [Achromobacter insolitus]|uniref:hypothetical protein n=1 Tax=Achromobacter insolitus TaxID=217204 RepID=UPI000DD118EA|nr:hypothetical protein [Achromobacter insolitus]AXA71393.1 hypothetical protein CE205_12640 [Achromobacter insolitus]
MLDSSFLICLSTDERREHETARQYFVELIQRQVPIYLSTIAICEYEVRQRITDLGVANFLVLPFNIDDAIGSAKIFDRLFSAKSSDDDRVAVKDDAKLIGQCVLTGISHFLTSDTKCAKRIGKIRDAGVVAGLPMPIDIQEPFSPHWFNDGNQFSFLESE